MAWINPERKLREEQEAAAERGDWDAVLKALDKESKREMIPGDEANKVAGEIGLAWGLEDAPHASTRRELRALHGAAMLRSGSAPGKGKRSAPARAVRVSGPEGEDWRKLGNDRAAIWAFLTARAEDSGRPLDELARPFAPGKPRAAEAERYRDLARIVREAHERGATEVAIGAVLGRRKQRISELIRAST